MNKSSIALVFLVSMTVLSLVSVGVAAAACGDDVDGKRVPCRCGDVVVSDTRLQSGDPVVSDRCRSDGLVVRAAAGAGSITLDLAGHSLIGMGHGTGIRVFDGGSEGAVIIGGDGTAKAEVVGFGAGFKARGQRSVKTVRNVRFVGNERDGVMLRGAGSELVGVVAEGNGRDGVRAGGRNPRLEAVEVINNARHGLRVTSPNAEVSDAITIQNGKPDAIRSRGSEGGDR